MARKTAFAEQFASDAIKAISTLMPDCLSASRKMRSNLPGCFPSRKRSNALSSKYKFVIIVQAGEGRTKNLKLSASISYSEFMYLIGSEYSENEILLVTPCYKSSETSELFFKVQYNIINY